MPISLQTQRRGNWRVYQTFSLLACRSVDDGWPVLLLQTPLVQNDIATQLGLTEPAHFIHGFRDAGEMKAFPVDPRVVVDRRAQFQAESLRRRFQSERTNTTLACADAFTGTLTYLAMLASSGELSRDMVPCANRVQQGQRRPGEYL